MGGTKRLRKNNWAPETRRRQAERMRELWADPEWAAMTRRRAAEGVVEWARRVGAEAKPDDEAGRP